MAPPRKSVRAGDTFGDWTVLTDPVSRQHGKQIRHFVMARCACGHEVEKISYMMGKSPHCRNCRNKLVNGLRKKDDWHHTVMQVKHSYKSAATARGYDFELTFEDVEKIIIQNCLFCGSEPSNQWGTQYALDYQRSNRSFVGRGLYTGIDRLDNTKGYTVDNCVPCCKICNRAKSDLPVDQWNNWLDKVAAQRKEIL